MALVHKDKHFGLKHLQTLNIDIITVIEANGELLITVIKANGELLFKVEACSNPKVDNKGSKDCRW